MPNVIHYLDNWNATDDTGVSRPKYLAGEFYPESEETVRHVAQGIAESIDVTDVDADTAAARAAKAMAKAATAMAVAYQAQVLAGAAAAAAQMDIPKDVDVPDSGEPISTPAPADQADATLSDPAAAPAAESAEPTTNQAE
jgi:hypothetical protein